MFFFGILGWFIRACNYPVIAFMVGLILGRRLEDEIYRYASLFGSGLTVFIEQPIAGFLAVSILFTFGMNLYKFWRKSREIPDRERDS
jgi:TctA family transporter